MDPRPDRPPTRHLERLEVDRFRPFTTTMREMGDGFVVLDVSGASDTAATRLPDGVALAGERVEAGSLTVRVDAIGPRAFRYRFALGTDVPAGDTPMLATDVRVVDAARCERTGFIVRPILFCSSRRSRRSSQSATISIRRSR